MFRILIIQTSCQGKTLTTLHRGATKEEVLQPYLPEAVQAASWGQDRELVVVMPTESMSSEVPELTHNMEAQMEELSSVHLT